MAYSLQNKERHRFRPTPRSGADETAEDADGPDPFDGSSDRRDKAPQGPKTIGRDMSNTIIKKEQLIPDQTSKLVIDAPRIAAKAQPGNFVILRVHAKGERIPLTIADVDKENGTITIVYLVLGKSTAMLEELGEGDAILDLCGPLGKETHIEKMETVVCVGGGTGIAAMHHIAKGHHMAGNKVVGHHRRAQQGPAAFRKGAAALRLRGAHLHGRRQRRPQGLCHRAAQGAARTGQDGQGKWWLWARCP